MPKDMAWIDKAKDWLLQNSTDFAFNLIVFILIIFIGKLVINGLCKVLEKNLKKSQNVSEILCDFIVNISKKVALVVLFMLALPRLGIDVAPLIAGLGVTGFIVGFAFQQTLGNLAAGLMLLINQPFKKGDFIDAGGTTGVVQDMGIMATTLTSPDNKRITVPNGSIWGTCITNYTALDTRRVDLSMGIAYGADINKAREVALNILSQHELVLNDPKPVVEVVEMADSSVNFVVRPWTKTENYWTVFFGVNQQIKEGLDKAGIEIPFPQVDVHQR